MMSPKIRPKPPNTLTPKLALSEAHAEEKWRLTWHAHMPGQLGRLEVKVAGGCGATIFGLQGSGCRWTASGFPGFLELHGRFRILLRSQLTLAGDRLGFLLRKLCNLSYHTEENVLRTIDPCYGSSNFLQ